MVRCQECRAQFDEVEGQRLKLVCAPHDSYGVAAQYAGKTFFRHAWTRLAHGLALGAGNCVCEKCHAEWNFDLPGQTLRLLQCDAQFAQWKNQTHGLSQWKFLCAGKSSGRAGSKCENCALEFDEDKGLLRLVSTPAGPLAAHGGERFSLSDWHRLAARIPTAREEANLRAEAQRLEHRRNQEIAATRQTQERDRQNLEHELDALARQSFLDGFLDDANASLARAENGEAIRWMSNATFLKRRTRQNVPYWDIDSHGALMITDSRLVFLSAPGVEHWSRPRQKIKRVETIYVAGQPLLEIHFHGLKNPLGFVVSEMTLDVVVAGQSRRQIFTAGDLVTWLSSQK